MAGTFDLTLRASYTIPASSDNDAIAKVQAALEAEFGAVSTIEVSAVVSPEQSVPGSTTYDVLLEAIVTSVALSLSDSLSKVSFKSLGQAVLKAGKVHGSTESAPPA